MKVRRFLMLLIFVLTLGTLFSSMASAEGIQKKNLVALGDSITFGWNLDPANPGPSPQAFPNLIADGGFNVTNLGTPGWTSTKLLNELNTNPLFAASLKTADVVTLDIGSNDLLQAAGFNPSAPGPIDLNSPLIQGSLFNAQKTFMDNLSKIITIIKGQTSAPIIVYNIYNPFPQVPDAYPNAALINNLHSAGELIIPSANDKVIKPIALQLGLSYADAYTAFNGNQAALVIAGDIHPTVDGHKTLANLANPILKQLGLYPTKDNTTPTPTPTPTVTPLQPSSPAPAASTGTTSTPTTTTSTSTGTTYSLPNTATPSYNYLGAGLLMIFAGLSAAVIQRKKQRDI